LANITKILIYGYGNPGRQDDGLGNLFVELTEKWAKDEGLTNLSFDSNYQLNIEDSANIVACDIVIFIDASLETIEDFVLTEITPSPKVEFSMHSVSASFVVKLCNDIYEKTPKSFLLHLKGYEWDFKTGITQRALENLNKAFEFMKPLIKSPEKIEIAATENKI
jgi:hydrogenase maturation protease